MGPVRKPHCWFSHEAAHIEDEEHMLQSYATYNKVEPTYYSELSFERAICRQHFQHNLMILL